MQAAETEALTPRGVAEHVSVHRIQASRWLVPVDVRELWRYRDLIRFFVLRDVKSRYRQTFLGPAWALLRPVLTIVVFSVIFGNLAGISPGTSIPYTLWVTPAVLAFGYVSTALTTTSTSLVTNSNLITKVYFPRLSVPIATTITPIADLLLGMLVLFGLFAYFDRTPSWHIVFLPAFVALAVLVTTGIGFWMAAFSARYRDVVFGVPFLVQTLQYATPIIYPVTFVPPHYRWLLDLNPFTAVVAGFRWSFLGLPFGSLVPLVTSISIGVGATAIGLFFFRRTERYMVDLL